MIIRQPVNIMSRKEDNLLKVQHKDFSILSFKKNKISTKENDLEIEISRSFSIIRDEDDGSFIINLIAEIYINGNDFGKQELANINTVSRFDIKNISSLENLSEEIKDIMKTHSNTLTIEKLNYVLKSSDFKGLSIPFNL